MYSILYILPFIIIIIILIKEIHRTCVGLKAVIDSLTQLERH